MSAECSASPDPDEAGAGAREHARFAPGTGSSALPRDEAPDHAPSGDVSAPTSPSSPSPTDLLDVLERLSSGDDRLVGHVTLPGRPERITDWPQWVCPALMDAWARRGVERPWFHQREAMDALREGRDVVLATGTGSGKSLAAWTPILSDLVEAEDSSRISAIHRRPSALYLAPTKALAADQLASLMSLLGQDVTPEDAQGDGDPEGGPGLVDERLRRVRATTVDG
ncbi:DEAD/DEAH box helicase, partial [uncultured Actinomyces sp.]|uniref:DEAD/DEAH box helicase n=1 Tax=uncultured Actinomyces sp. TaxID=249061 RepID=UPI0037DC3C6F